MFVLRDGDQRLVGDIGHELRLTGAQHLPRAERRVQVDREARDQLAGEADHLRPYVRDRRLAHDAGLEHLDEAPVGERRYRELGDGAERGLDVERAGEPRARLGEEGEAPLRRLGDVLQPLGFVLRDHRRGDVVEEERDVSVGGRADPEREDVVVAVQSPRRSSGTAPARPSWRRGRRSRTSGPRFPTRARVRAFRRRPRDPDCFTNAGFVSRNR